MGYEVTLTIGRGTSVHTWTIGQGDPAAYGPLAGLTITRDVLDEFWPPADAPAECRVQLLAGQFSALPFVYRGAVVEAIVRTGPGGAILDEFHGRVTDGDATPHSLGVLFTLVCVEFQGDLREVDAYLPANGSSVSFDPESAYSRLSRVVRRLGYAASPLPPPLDDDGPILAVPAEAAIVKAYDYVQRIVRQYVFFEDTAANPAGGVARAVLVPVFGNGTMHPPTTWTVKPRWEKPSYTGPLRLEVVDGVYVLVWDPVPGGVPIIPASALDFSSRYAATPRDGITSVTINAPAIDPPDYTASLSTYPPVGLTMESDLTNFVEQVALAELYLPAEQSAQTWVAEAFKYYVEADLPGTSVPRELGSLAVVHGIPTKYSPTGRDYYPGRVARRSLAVQGGQVVIEVQLRRPDFAADKSTALRLDDPSLAGATLDTLEPTLTFDDFRLARGATP